MPRHPRNTNRGSCVLLRKRQQERKWHVALTEKAAHRAPPLRRIASLHCLPYKALCKRWRRFLAAEFAGDAAGMEAAERVRRGGHNRTFDDAHEAVLRSVILASEPAMGHQQIREAALQLRRDIDVARHTRTLRSRPAFTASDGFITAFKQRNRLSSHRTALLHVSDRELAGRDVDKECFDFLNTVRAAVEEYGERLVLNMDETPTAMCDAPVTAVVATASNAPARIKTAFLTRHNITTFPCIAADGSKLSLCAIIKGKTKRVFKKITDGASAAVRSVRLYKSIKGWMTEEIMLQWFKDVVAPHTMGQPAALLLDRYGCHWTSKVQYAAAMVNLQLIQVPGGCTSILQPLDVEFNGPMLKARQRIWREKKLMRPFDKDTPQAAVERTQLAYASMSKAMTREAWRKAQLLAN